MSTTRHVGDPSINRPADRPAVHQQFATPAVTERKCAAHYYSRRGVVRLSVSRSLLIATVSLAKTAEPIEIPFGAWTRVDPRNHALDRIAPTIRDTFEGACPHSDSHVKHLAMPPALTVTVATCYRNVCAWGATLHFIGPNTDWPNQQQAIRPRPDVVEKRTVV